MVKLNIDVLYLILKNLKNDSISLYSCLLANRIWCEAAIPILWKIPGQVILTTKAVDILFKVVLSQKQGMNDLFTKVYRPPSFNYINFWRHLNLRLLGDMINLRYTEESNVNIIMNQLLKLFINKNTKFISLFIPYSFNYYQIHNISWAEQCFSSLKFLYCHDKVKNIVEGLSTITSSIK
ncbi:hypothetical protein GLOIN_2v1681949 [Rhizophagus clarus]|uniref:F-box domain-containing protein n=1 Tax=Rhizophagus clarus TaxID=94130 RepID=A0A8H3R0S5_9GLOM|nr:hypothetical protein GLOIN_2v1681949 [Rhizophagus clarus]